MLRRLLATTSIVAVAAALLTAPAAGAVPEPVDWGENLVTGGGFESPMAVGDHPAGWTVLGQDTNPVAVVDVGANGSAQSIKVPGRPSRGGALRGLTWEFDHPMQSLKIEFSFAVPDFGNSRTLEFWTRAPGASNDVSQVVLTYDSHTLKQAASSVVIANSLLTSDPTGTMNWYRIRMVTDQDSGLIKYWLSDANGPLPSMDTVPVVTGTYHDGLPFGSINMGFNHMYAPTYYWVDDVDVRGVEVPGPEEGSLDPFDSANLISNSGFEYDSPGADPAGWTQAPYYRYDTVLGVDEVGAPGSAQSVRIQGLDNGDPEGLTWFFDEPQEKIQAEFSLAYAGDGQVFDFWTGGQAHYSGVNQLRLRVVDDQLQAYGFHWQDVATLTPSEDVDADGTLRPGTDDITWNRVRVITTADGGFAAIWVAGADGTFADEPTAVVSAGVEPEPIGSVAFGYGTLATDSWYYIDDVTVRGMVDDDAGPTPGVDRYPLWDGLEGPRTGVGAPEPAGMTITTIHAPGCQQTFEDDPECQTPADPEAGTASCVTQPPTYPVCLTDVRVHDDYMRFLHGAAVAEHDGVIWVSWENGLKNENSQYAMQRGRYSTDGGQTWSAPVVIGPDPDWTDDGNGPLARSHGAFIEQDGHLYAFVTTFGPGNATATFKSDLHAELWVVDETDHTWSMVNPNVLDNVWPLEPPRKMADGNYIVAGVTKDYGPVVAISHGDNITEQWDTVVIPGARFSDETSNFHYTEAATWVDGSTITVVLRNQLSVLHYRAAGVAISHDYGRSWELLQHVYDSDLNRVVQIPEMESNLPQTPANIFLGKLSTGQRYLIGNIHNRADLNILVSRPGERMLSRSFLIQGDAGSRPPFYVGSGGPQFNQPYAIEVTESDGENYLYVVYSDAKERAMFVKIPVASLWTELPALASASLPSHVMVEPGGTVTMPASAARVDGVPLDLDVATVSYHTDRPDLVSFDGDRVTVSEQALGLPPVQVWVQVSFGGRVITSPAVQVHVLPSDVHENNPFYDDLTWAITHGVAEGYPDGTFQPLRDVSRGQWAAFVWRSAHPGQQDPTCDPAGERVFGDVSADLVLCGVIEALAAEGMANGYPDGSFRPGADIKRGQLAAFLFRWLHPGVADPECSGAYRTFVDVPASLVLCGDIEWLAAAGLTLGFPDGTFHPGDAVTRQSAAAFLHRVALLPAGSAG